MLRIERDPAFWGWICSDPDVKEMALKDQPIEAVSHFVQRGDVLPLASLHGGFLFRNVDGLGNVLELHTLFRREGWGREVAQAAKFATRWVFGENCKIIYTHEQAGSWRSIPPKSHGWRKADEVFSPSPVGDLRIWYLTPELWRASPVNRDHS